jgi:hypothetical protein
MIGRDGRRGKGDDLADSGGKCKFDPYDRRDQKRRGKVP